MPESVPPNVTAVVMRDGSTRSIQGRVAQAIADILRAQDVINSSLKCKIIVNSVGKVTESGFELET